MSDRKIISRKDAKAKGLKHYFTGKPCPKGHVSERFVSKYNCVECCSEQNKKKFKGVKRHFVDDEELIELIKSYSTYSEFRNSKEYTIAMKRGLHDYAISIFGYGKTTKRWDEKSCIDEAKKFSTRSEFCKNSSGAYDAALGFGILGECCNHMKRPICDADVCYIWGRQEGGSFICKAGITSSRLGLSRIEYVSRKSGITPEFAWYFISDKARDMEKKILELGEIANLNDVSGWTEFRILSKIDIENVKGMAKWNSVAMNGLTQDVGV